MINYKKLYEKEKEEKQQAQVIANKFNMKFLLLNQWMNNREQGYSVSNYFLKNNFRCIAIYGMGEFGEHLYIELKDTGIKVKYAIDRKAYSIFPELAVKTLQDTLEMVDAVVITTMNFGDIEKQLRTQLTCPVISMEEVICES